MIIMFTCVTLGCRGRHGGLRWLNTVLRAVSGNSRDGSCFKLLNKLVFDMLIWDKVYIVNCNICLSLPAFENLETIIIIIISNI